MDEKWGVVNYFNTPVYSGNEIEIEELDTGRSGSDKQPDESFFNDLLGEHVYCYKQEDQEDKPVLNLPKPDTTDKFNAHKMKNKENTQREPRQSIIDKNIEQKQRLKKHDNTERKKNQKTEPTDDLTKTQPNKISIETVNPQAVHNENLQYDETLEKQKEKSEYNKVLINNNIEKKQTEEGSKNYRKTKTRGGIKTRSRVDKINQELGFKRR